MTEPETTKPAEPAAEANTPVQTRTAAELGTAAETGTAPAPLVRVDGLEKTFSIGFFRKKVEAVRGVSFEVRPGEIFGVLGPNGAGKTTTIKMLLGLIFPTKGTLSLFGRARPEPEVMKRLGYLPENPYVYQYLKPHEFLDLCGRLCGIPANERKKKSDAILERVGLSHAVDRPIGRFSKGMTQRIGLAPMRSSAQMSRCSCGCLRYSDGRLGATTACASTGLTLSRTQPLGPLTLPLSSPCSSAAASSMRRAWLSTASPSSVRLRPWVLRWSSRTPQAHSSRASARVTWLTGTLRSRAAADSVPSSTMRENKAMSSSWKPMRRLCRGIAISAIPTGRPQRFRPAGSFSIANVRSSLSVPLREKT